MKLKWCWWIKHCFIVLIYKFEPLWRALLQLIVELTTRGSPRDELMEIKHDFANKTLLYAYITVLLIDIRITLINQQATSLILVLGTKTVSRFHYWLSQSLNWLPLLVLFQNSSSLFLQMWHYLVEVIVYLFFLHTMIRRKLLLCLLALLSVFKDNDACIGYFGGNNWFVWP